MALGRLAHLYPRDEVLASAPGVRERLRVDSYSVGERLRVMASPSSYSQRCTPAGTLSLLVTTAPEVGMSPFQILPAERGFFEWFEKGAVTARDAARLLSNLLADYRDAEGRVLQITELEHQGDFIVHETLNLLSRTFITPLEGDEIRALVSAIDDVTDWIEDAADALILYEVQKPIPEVQRMAELLVLSTEQMVEVMPLLREKKHYPRIKAYTVEINRLENEADRVLRSGLTRLVRERGDWFEFMRWKEILEKIEEATDKCEDAADILEAVAVQNA